MNNKVITSFVKRREEQIQYAEEAEEWDIDMFDQSVQLGQFALRLIETGLEEYGINFDYKENPELKGDMFVILNIMVAMFLRDAGIKHILQDDIEKLKARILELDKHKDDTT